MFQVDSDLLGLLELLQHLQHALEGIDPCRLSFVDGLPGNRFGLLIDAVGVFRFEDLGFVRVLVPNLSVNTLD